MFIFNRSAASVIGGLLFAGLYVFVVRWAAEDIATLPPGVRVEPAVVAQSGVRVEQIVVVQSDQRDRDQRNRVSLQRPTPTCPNGELM